MRGVHSTRRVNQPLTMPVLSYRAPRCASVTLGLATGLLGLVGVTAAAVAATPPPVDPAVLDLENRIEYGYYTEDGRTLEGLARQPGAEAPDGMKSYYAGLAGYRLALLESSKDKDRARAGAEG